MSGDGFAKLHVMVADDHPHARKILVAILRTIGVRRITEVDDGAHALEAFKFSPADIVFTDLRMAGVDGFELIRFLRDERANDSCYVPIIVVSAQTSLTAINQARNLGATEFIGKPLTATAVIQRLRVCIENPRPFIRSKHFFGPDRRRRNIDTLIEERRAV